jgi:uncharacterized protein (DUF169 family)
MNVERLRRLSEFLDRIGLDEEPMGLFYTDTPPETGFSPRPLPLPTREKEERNEVDWSVVFGSFSCVMGNLWRARRKQKAAVFDAQRFGCPGGAFWLGFMKPQSETIIHYVSSGIPGHMKGERYCESPEQLRITFDTIDPVPAPKPYCVIQPIRAFEGHQEPELVIFFARPETLSGLHQLAFFLTNDPEAVMSPWAAACGSIAAWPLRYREEGRRKAVMGGWDCSARKFFKTDELSFTVPVELFRDMLDRFDESFLRTETWATVRKKIARSRKAWGKGN